MARTTNAANVTARNEYMRLASKANADAARVAYMRSAATRAVDDPRTLGRAARIVTEALRRDVLTYDDIKPE